MLLNRNNLAIAQFASKEESRYTLQGIQITPNGTVVTDGHQLVRVSTPTMSEKNYPDVAGFEPHEEFTPFVLPVDAAKDIAKAIPKSRNLPILNHARVSSNGAVQIVTTDLDNPRIFAPKPAAGQFPEWQRVFPSGKPEFEIFLNAELLAGLAKEAARYKDRSHCVRLRFYGDTQAVRFDTVNDEGQTFTAVLMPMRKGDEKYYGDESTPEPAVEPES